MVRIIRIDYSVGHLIIQFHSYPLKSFDRKIVASSNAGREKDEWQKKRPKTESHGKY